MFCRFTNSDITSNQKFFINLEAELVFIYELIALSGTTEVNIENKKDEVLAELFNSIGIKTIFNDNNIEISKTTIHHPETIIKDFSDFPQLGIPFSIVCAANGIQADLKGLESLRSENGPDIISLLQRELYHFNINTDFCDGSKLKIYNNKPIHPKSKPINVSTDDSLSISFIPLVAYFGKIEIELKDDFFEKYPWLDPLLLQLNFLIEKI